MNETHLGGSVFNEIAVGSPLNDLVNNGRANNDRANRDRMRVVGVRAILWGCCGLVLMSGCANFATVSSDWAGRDSQDVQPDEPGPDPTAGPVSPTEFPRRPEVADFAGPFANTEKLEQRGPGQQIPGEVPGSYDEFESPGNGSDPYPVSPAGYQSPAAPQAPAPRIYQSAPRTMSGYGVPPADTGPYLPGVAGPVRQMQSGPVRQMQSGPVRQMQSGPVRQMQSGQYAPPVAEAFRQMQSGQYQPAESGPYRQPLAQVTDPSMNYGRRVYANPPLQNGVVQMEMAAAPVMNGMGLNGSALGRRAQTATELAIQLRYENGVLYDKNGDLVQRIEELDDEVAEQTDALEHSKQVLEEANRSNASLREMIAKLRVEIQDINKEKLEIEQNSDRALKEIEATLNSLLLNRISPVQGSGGTDPGGQ